MQLRNKEFDYHVSSLVDSYFAPEKLEESDQYIQVGIYKRGLAEQYTTNGGDQQINYYEALDGKSILCPSIFGDYEKMLFSHFFFGNQNTYIISGPMGSGKTTSINYVFEKAYEIDECKDIFFVKLDFGGISTTGDIDISLNSFIELMYDLLEDEIKKKCNKYVICNEFMLYVKNNGHKCPGFSKMHSHWLDERYEEWCSLPEHQKLSKIFQHIEDKSHNYQIRLSMVMRFLNFFNTFLLETCKDKHITQAIIFFDNIDKLLPALQKKIIAEIISYSDICQVKKIIAARRSTKAKFDRMVRDTNPIFPNRAQHPYGHIYHHGPKPTTLYIKKLEIIAFNIDTIKSFKLLPPHTKNALVGRANEVLDKLSGKKLSPFWKAFYSIAGESNRIGLTVAARPFCNHIIPNNELSLNTQSLIRTLYVGSTTDNYMNRKDLYVANLFCDHNYNFTLVNITILQLLKFFQNQPVEISKHCTSKNIYELLTLNFYFSDFEIVASLNYLMQDKRALVGGENKSFYYSSDDIYQSNDLLRITELGDRYLDLLIYGDVYVQTCLMSVDWVIDVDRKLNLNDETFLERFSHIRFCLNTIQREEEYRNNIFDYNNIKNNSPHYHIDIFCDLVKLMSKAFTSVLTSGKHKNENENSRENVVLNKKQLRELNLWHERLLFWSSCYKQKKRIFDGELYTIENILKFNGEI